MRGTFSSSDIETRANILHGEINDLGPDEAVGPVLATTHLRVERNETTRGCNVSV